MNVEVLKEYLPEIVTQLLGFLIVFWVLKKFAFKSILGAIDARRHKIEHEFSDIEKQKKGLEDLEKEYRQKLEKIEESAREKIQEAATIGQNLAKDIQEGARLEAKRLFDRTQSDIQQEIAKGRLTMRNEIVELSSMITEKILREKLDAREHEKMVEKFVKELERIG